MRALQNMLYFLLWHHTSYVHFVYFFGYFTTYHNNSVVYFSLWLHWNVLSWVEIITVFYLQQLSENRPLSICEQRFRFIIYFNHRSLQNHNLNFVK